MDLNNIERNQLDYILTDVIPVEISEQFTYRYFYDFLNEKSQDIEVMKTKVLDMKNKNNAVLFKDSNWITMPLKYTIMKELHSEREMSLLQPLAAVELFLFISAYQKEMVSLLAKNSVFSLRFHRKNNDLFYKNKNKSVTKYFADLGTKTGREIIEQTGMYFDIGPFKSIASFTASEKWPLLNSKYKYFIRTDYKACFDSIYSHAFNWIIGKDVNDTKGFRNGSVYTSIDRVLMNINACTSNGIVVGPEFSRMVAELLLQTIDRDVFSMLLNQNYVAEENYNVFRFVDDLFIFAESEELAHRIVELYAEASRKYLLRLNESKLYESRVPFVLETWYSETNLASNRASSLLFYTREERKKFVEEFYRTHDSQESFKPHLLKAENLSNHKKAIMNQFNVLICKYENKARTIVAYYLGMILNKVGKNKGKVRIFDDNVSAWTAFELIDLSLYIYSFFPNYSNTQRLLAIIGYVNDEKSIMEEHELLREKVNKYAFVFDKANTNDIVNLILFCRQAKVEIPYKQELRIVNSLREKDDPILWASYLLYSQYSKKYFEEIKNEIEALLKERIEAIVQKNSIYTYREFWWVLIFNKCPFLSKVEQDDIDDILNKLKVGTGDQTGDILGRLFTEYVKNNPVQFFEWNLDNKDFIRTVTFKTRQRSIFRNYLESLPSLYWSSI